MESFEDDKTPPLEGLPPLAQANVLAALLETETSRSEVPNPETVLRLTDAIDSVEVEEVLRDINEERSVASFGSAPSPAILSAEIESLRERHLRSVRSALDILPSRALATTMGRLAETWTASGTKPHPAFELIPDVTSPRAVFNLDVISCGYTMTSLPLGDGRNADQHHRHHGPRDHGLTSAPALLP